MLGLMLGMPTPMMCPLVLDLTADGAPVTVGA